MLPSLSAIELPAIVLMAFLVMLHMSFQLATSVLTLLTGHSLSRYRASRRVMTLNIAFISGAGVTTFLLLIGMTALAVIWIDPKIYTLVRLVLFSAMMITAMLIMVAYYRRGKGTQLWIPRRFAAFLSNRAAKTTNTVEALSLGIISVIAELPFTAVILMACAITLATQLPLDSHTFIVLVYAVFSVLPLLIIAILLSGGHRLSTIQRWRESNKIFLQYASGIGLVAAAVYVLVFFIIVQERL